jgi:hypothetical protein
MLECGEPMPDALRTILYVSTATMPMEARSVEQLLMEARGHNLKTGVTGVLLLYGGSFMQCIEGEGKALDETWRRIRASRRHTDVTELMNQPIAERAFADWQMGFFERTDSSLLSESTQRWVDSLDNAGDASVQRALLRQFWRNAR